MKHSEETPRIPMFAPPRSPGEGPGVRVAARPLSFEEAIDEHHSTGDAPRPNPLPENEGCGRTKLRAVTLGVTVIALAAFLAPASGQGPDPSAASRGRGADLLKSAPFDRITLVDNSVYEIEPLSPRPLPPPESRKGKTLVELEEMAKKAASARAKGEEEQVLIHLMDGEARDYKVKRASIKAVEYFEDMLLADGDRLAAAGDFARAFERYLLVKVREPAWKGLDERVDRLLYLEGGALLTEDNARGLRLLNDLHARRPDYPGLGDRLAASFARRIEKTFEGGEFAAGRRLLRELEKVAPDHAEAQAARKRFVARAKALVDEAGKLPPAERVDRLAEAARIWPDHDGLEASYREAFRAAPILTVAVVDPADSPGPFPRSPSAERVARLLYLPLLLSAEGDPSGRGEAPGQLLGGLEVAELGKGLKIRLKPGATWSDGSRPVAAIDVARSLADRAQPGSPGFNARWADLLDRVEAVDEDRVEVRLTRPSLKPEVWLLDLVGPAHAAADGLVPILEGGRRPVGDGPFRWVASGDGSTLLESATPGGPGRVRRLREVRHPKADVALDALARGDVGLLESVPPDRVAELRGKPEVRVGAYATPSVHRIALDGRTQALRNRKLRRALSLAIDRRALLEEVLLRRPPDEVNRVADGPFVRGSYVDAPDVAPFAYDPLLAKGLVVAARKDLGGNPIRLTFEYPATPEARATCPRIAEGLRLIGVEVEAIERAESDLESGLRSGRRFDLAYRASRPSQPLRDAGPLLVPGYDAPPSADALASAASPRILQLLLQMERAPETTSARVLARQVDRESRDELPVLALWQLEDHYAWRSHLRGPLDTADALYQGIATWEVDPWFARD